MHEEYRKDKTRRKEQTGAWTNIVLDLWYCVSRQQHLNNNIVSGCLSGHFLSLMLYGLPSSEEIGSCITITIRDNTTTLKVYLQIESGKA